jgi:hypothetical protein
MTEEPIDLLGKVTRQATPRVFRRLVSFIVKYSAGRWDGAGRVAHAGGSVRLPEPSRAYRSTSACYRATSASCRAIAACCCACRACSRATSAWNRATSV